MLKRIQAAIVTLAIICISSISFSMAFENLRFEGQQHLGPDENQVRIAQKVADTDKQSTTSSSGTDPLCLNACKKAKDCAALCRHLPAINHLAYTNGVGIFFRNGMLLGLVREQGFLKGELDDPDPDLACLETDIPQIQKIEEQGGWGDYKIEFGQMKDDAGKFNAAPPDMYDGRHPLTRIRVQYDRFDITHTPSGFKLDGGIWAVYDSAKKYLWYPWFSSESMLENEYKLAVGYNRAGGGPKMLLGETANEMKKFPSTLLEYRALIATAPTATNPKGRIGEVYPNFATVKHEARYSQFKFYGTFVYAPVNSREILQAEYGLNCLTHSIDKHHGNVESEVK